MSEDRGHNKPGEPAHKQLQQAHDRYFQELGQIWSGAQSHLQHVQTEYERALEKACRSQQQTEFQTAHEEYQRALQTASTDTAPLQQCAEAYHRYKTAIQQLLASANVDEMDFSDMARLSQSLFMVSRTAQGLTPFGQGFANPFEQK